jgi:hypothetical protein
MNKITTAEEFTKKLLTEVASCRGVRVMSSVIEKQFIEFAKLHVQEALKQAHLKAELNYYDSKESWMNDSNMSLNSWGAITSIDKDSILNAYPLENIK